MVEGGFCGNELILKFPAKSMPSGFRPAAVLEGMPLGTPYTAPRWLCNYTALLTPQKNGNGPGTTPLTFERHA
jgi:hypothetical protein